MKSELTLNLDHQQLDIPISIKKAILNLYGVDKTEDIDSKTSNKISLTINTFFNEERECDYSNKAKEYTLYYLPLNMYKIWRPLKDLLEKSQIKSTCDILELGSGPGTTTFGLLEFYKALANENPNVQFEINYTIVEFENSFIQIFKRIYNDYKHSLPSNLFVCFSVQNISLKSFFETTNQKFDYVVESNLINPNEKIDSSSINELVENMSHLLKKHSSLILIEPAHQNINIYLKEIRQKSCTNNLKIYSPCNCQRNICNQLPMATLNTQHISLLKELIDNNIITRSVHKTFHPFEYLILRNDTLVKSNICSNNGNIVKLSDLGNYINKRININAFIILLLDKGTHYSLKICDGTTEIKKGVWLKIPKDHLPQQCKLGRGGTIKLSKVYVESNTNLSCDLSTKIKMEI